MMEGAQEAQPDQAVTVVPSTWTEFAEGQRRILEAIATNAPLAETLERITLLVEREAPGMRASILLVDDGHLLFGAAPSLPAAYNEAIHGIDVGPTIGSCGAAAATGMRHVAEDVQTDPNWAAFRDLAASHGLRACWSTPVFGQAHEVLATFALYHSVPHKPGPVEERLVAEATHLASIAIQHHRFVAAEAKRVADSQRRLELRELFRHAPVAVSLMLGDDFRFEYVNPAYERLVNRTGLEGKRVIDVFPELEAQGFIGLLRSIYETGEAFESHDLRAEIDRGRGVREEAWFSGRTEPYRDAAGKVIGLFSVSVETTAQVRARMDLDARRTQIAMSEKASALGQLVSGVAHEIRTPLTYLATNLNLIQIRLERLMRTLPPDQADASRMLIEQYIPSALEGVDRISHIVEDLREFTQQRASTRAPVAVQDLVAQAVNLFQATHRGSVTVKLESAADAMATLDKVQVQQAILNLLQNALEAGPRDHTIVVRVTSDANAWRVDVTDTGRGIPEDSQARIFDPFFTTREGGTGLGLSIVRRIVMDHHGAISFDTGPSGTTFHLAFPLDRT